VIGRQGVFVSRDGCGGHRGIPVVKKGGAPRQRWVGERRGGFDLTRTKNDSSPNTITIEVLIGKGGGNTKR